MEPRDWAYTYICVRNLHGQEGVFCHAYSALMAHNRRPPRTQRVGAALGPTYLDCCAPVAVGCFSARRGLFVVLPGKMKRR